MTSPMPPSAGNVLSEKDALAELLAWAKDRPKWQQDALRRLVLNDALTEVDIDDLVGICLDPNAPSQPITSAHVAAEGASGEPIALVRIENPTGINALAIDQKLEFAKDGLTVIYGDNGSGKSGYVRVLKHACRTRDRGTKILRDVEDTGVTPQTAKIVFAQGVTEVDFAWTPDAAGHPDLPAVSIFDSRSANIHVEKTNAVAYIPQPMQILEALASACDRVKAKLDAQVTALEKQTPIALKASKLSTETAAGTFVHNLSAKSNLAQLALLSTLSVGEQQRLSTLEADLAQDPKRAAARVANHKTRLDEQVTALKRLAEATTSLAFAARERLKAERDAKAEAAKLASDALFAASPLPEIGQATWRSLWEAARKYSNEVAYPEKSFPDATVGGDLCVLCQQPLSADAVQRRTTFESFVKGTTKADEERAAKAYDAVLAKAAAARVAIDSIRQLQTLIATEIGDLALAERVKQYGIRAAWRLRAFAREQAAPGVQPSFPEADLSDLSMSLAIRAAQLSADQKSPEHLAELSLNLGDGRGQAAAA